MARPPRITPAGIPVHHIQRGNNRNAVFVDDRDRLLYRELLLEACRRHQCRVHAYVFMTNHVHLLVTPADDDGLSRMTQWMGRKYVTVFNRRHGRTGTLWEGRFHSSVIDSARYFLTCSRYIDQNPTRAGIATTPRAFVWSSYARLAFGIRDDLVSEHAEYTSLGRSSTERQTAYRALCDTPVDPDLARGIRRAARRGEVVGRSIVVRSLGARLATQLGRLPHGGDRRTMHYRTMTGDYAWP